MDRAPIQILLVEDEPDHVALIERAFEATGDRYQLAVAGTLASARRHLSAHQPALVMADWLLPDGQSISLLNGNPPDNAAPVIIMTSHGNERVAVEALRAGALDYVVKSEATLGDLPHIAERALHQWENTIQRQLAERALHESEQRYRAIMEQASDVIFLVDSASLQLIEANQAFQRLLGYEASQLIGLPLAQIIADEGDLADQFASLLGPRTSSGRELRYRCRDGTQIELETNLSQLQIGERPVFCAVARDISERKHLEAQLRQAQKLQAIGQLAGGLAHDFNNLLTIILSYSDILIESLAPIDPALQRDAEQIHMAGERASTLTRQLLAFSRRQVLDISSVNINQIIQTILKMLKRLIGEHIDLRTFLDPQLGQIRADAGQIEQVIMNLVVNARDAMPNGGTLTIETANIDVDEHYAQQRIEMPEGQYVLFSVSDTGVGMDQQTQQHIFEPFFTTKGPGQGTGLGLAMVHGIVNQCEGHIWAYSELSHGTTFKIYFPRSDQPASVLSPPAPQPQQHGGAETILLVEDDTMVRQLAREILARNGYTVLEASSEDAPQLVASRDGIIDLLLTDVVMPKVNGHDLAQQLTALRPNLKVLYMSGYTDNVMVYHHMIGSGAAFISKPFTPSGLSAKVRSVLDQ